jgi:hypothetical protein
MDYIMDTKVFHSSLQMPPHLQFQGLVISIEHLLPYFFINKVILQAYSNFFASFCPMPLTIEFLFLILDCSKKNNLLGVDWHGGNP